MRYLTIHSGIAALLMAGLLLYWPAGLLAGGLISIDKGAKEEPYQSQVGLTFTNTEKQATYGLEIEFSSEAEVAYDDRSNDVGPFTTIQGNSSRKIKLMRPVKPIKPGDPGIALVFRSYKAKVGITKWWWLDEKDKRIGYAHKVN
jgi:hypothetical protein